MDLLPTLLAAIGAPPPERRKLDGENLLALLTGKEPTHARTVFWRYKRGRTVRKAVRDGDWKYVFDSGAEELHDLSRDEQEKTDLAPRHPDIVRDLRAKLVAWEKDVAAPRLRGFPRPAG